MIKKESYDSYDFLFYYEKRLQGSLISITPGYYTIC